MKRIALTTASVENIGPGDPTDRYTYWPVRMARGGELFAVTYWTEPAGDYLGMMQVNGDKAFAAGFEMRPLEQTARETLEWFNAQDAERQELRSGLMPEREAELLAAFRG